VGGIWQASVCWFAHPKPWVWGSLFAVLLCLPHIHTTHTPATHQGCSSCQKLGRSPGTPDVLAPAS
jgi:hypothetical protein